MLYLHMYSIVCRTRIMMSFGVVEGAFGVTVSSCVHDCELNGGLHC